MFNFSEVIPKSDFEYWFVRKGVTQFYDVYHQTFDKKGKLKTSILLGADNEIFDSPGKFKFEEKFKDSVKFDIDRYLGDFSNFRAGRPEEFVGKQIPKCTIESDENKGEKLSNVDIYERLIVGVLLLQYDDAEALKIAEKYLTWLRGTDFYTAPGSTMYHDAEPCGLLKHTLRTVNNTVKLMHLSMFNTVVPQEAVLAALVHDLCKIGIYEPFMRNVKNEELNVWEKVPSFRYKASETPLGHGTTSMYLAKKFFDLSFEVSAAVRWHMGAWNTAQSDNTDLRTANTTYPLVHLLQWADQSSITVYGVD